jgi:hypothetical protein
MEIISPDQLAFLPMHFILDNLFLTQETIHYARHSTQPLMFLKLDFSKAYNQVDLSFFYSAMSLMGFPEAFISMTKLLFTGAKASISVNGRCTPHFPANQGVRQGCPLATYLFLIVGEELNHCVKKEAQLGRIRGICLPGSEEQQLIIQFMDNTSMTLAGEEVVVIHTINTLYTFSLGSGLTLNWEKSAGYC